jgi:SAM-dependent methyltransferase
MSHMEKSQHVCPACRSSDVGLFYEAPKSPANSVLLVPTRQEAVTFPTGDIRLGFCATCGFIYNTCFDPRLVEYSSRCEETQGFSPFFQKWHEGLARRLIDRYSLYRKKIVEIGCGKGEFLALLCDLGENRGIGFDPAYVSGRIAPGRAGSIEFIPHFYSETSGAVDGDLLCCKMTLEHIPEVHKFVAMVRQSLQHSPDANVFFQVPNASRILAENSFWDIYYEHCSYFNVASLAGLFHRVGFDVRAVGREYLDQYITLEAKVASKAPTFSSPIEDNLSELKTLVDSFAIRAPECIAGWRKRLEEYRSRGLKTVVWGAGSKGVTFLSVLNVPGAVGYVVDINPNMSRHYLVKTGIEIVNPPALRDYRPDVVIVMNPIYRDEIVATLAGYGLAPEVIST